MSDDESPSDAELARLREYMRIQARVVVEKNAELASARQELDAVRTARDNLDRELAEARKATGWIVARDGGRYCERCEQEIRRGEAYELQDGTGGLLLHIHCRDGATE